MALLAALALLDYQRLVCSTTDENIIAGFTSFGSPPFRVGDRNTNPVKPTDHVIDVDYLYDS